MFSHYRLKKNETKQNKNMTFFQFLAVMFKQNFSATPFTTDFAGNYAPIALR